MKVPKASWYICNTTPTPKAPGKGVGRHLCVYLCDSFKSILCFWNHQWNPGWEKYESQLKIRVVPGRRRTERWGWLTCLYLAPFSSSSIRQTANPPLCCHERRPWTQRACARLSCSFWAWHYLQFFLAGRYSWFSHWKLIATIPNAWGPSFLCTVLQFLSISQPIPHYLKIHSNVSFSFLLSEVK